MHKWLLLISNMVGDVVAQWLVRRIWDLKGGVVF